MTVPAPEQAPAGAQLAADLFDALLREAAEWADDSETGWAERLWTMPPAEALTAIEQAHVVPSHLAGPVISVLWHLDPATYRAGDTADG